MRNTEIISISEVSCSGAFKKGFFLMKMGDVKVVKKLNQNVLTPSSSPSLMLKYPSVTPCRVRPVGDEREMFRDLHAFSATT